ncbi:MAG: site-specific integrase [Zoogloeaceae bacterium]|nr:site-specific integrase [Zoogloeaceae bacterium]
MIFENIIGTYLAARKQERGESERDRCSYKRLHPYFAGRDIRALKLHDVRAYIAHRQAQGVKLTTIRRELCLFCAAINFVNVEFDLTLPNPVSRLSIPTGEPRVRWITRQEAAKLLHEAEQAACRPHLPIFIRLALNTGCRRGELLNLEWSRVDTEHKKILLEAKHTKTRKRRAVPLNDDALRTLTRIKHWQTERKLNTPYVFGYEKGKITTFKTSWKTALQRSGIENFRIHDLRHTFASWLVMEGVSVYVVKDLLGHASVTQTEIYAHLAPDQGREAVQRLLL